MKINIEIDCTPQEARSFLGLPDVSPLHEAMMKEIQNRMTANLKVMDPEVLMKVWMPANLQGLEQIQKAFWSQMTGATDPNKNKKE